ncbi:MAG: FAD-binding oxidoreductase [Dehalococcoidia bacterium]|nr:FAD-binding oxidoreductase [Dehalococcoidia bacterium]
MSTKLLDELRNLVGSENLLHKPEDLLVYELDGTIDRALPEAVVFPANTEEVQGVVHACNTHEVPVTPRGAGTGLSGGAIPARQGVIVGTARMRRILNVDPLERTALVEPGAPNIQLSEIAAEHGLFYAPDPSSQKACTIGGNVAENAGGPHCLALGVTTNHVVGMEVVTASGELEWLGSYGPDSTGYDLRGLFIGSEGTLGIATKVAVRLLPIPETVVTLLAIFDDVEHASETVSAVIGAGLVPAALEMMDRVTLQAAEEGLRCGYPPNAGAVLLIELDGIEELVQEQVQEARAACNKHGATEIRTATEANERTQLWKGRKGAIGALGRIAPNYYLLDGVVPRSKLVETMGEVSRISQKYKFPVANVFHAGDGNLHPCLLFDERDEGSTAKVLEAGAEIMQVCVDAGGALTGEHGVGYEKNRFMPLLYSETDLENMRRVREIFGNSGTFNPCKVLPEGTGCGEMAHQKGALQAAGPEAYV